MRLFVAVEVDDRTRLVAERVQKQLQCAWISAVKARWVPVDNLHLTVRFIGHVDDARATGIIDALTPPLDIPPFDIELGGCGAFPPSGPPRVAWIGLTRGLPALAAIHEGLNRRLEPLGFAPERRAFSAHLTLARMKDAPAAARRPVRAELERLTVPPVVFAVNRATVFESHLSSKGPRYEPVGFIPLNGEP
jgi:2'-5' RNA ligase